MKSTRVRVILAVAAAGVALTACSPTQAGAAAVVGGQRISSSQLDGDVRELEAALAKAGGSAAQLQSYGSLPQLVLYQTATAKQLTIAAERKGVTATDGEIDQLISTAGGQAQYEQQMLQQAVPPSQMRAYAKASLLASKLAAKYGGGTDQAALQRGSQLASKDVQAVKISWNPRYGTFNAQPSQQQPRIFLTNDRFGKAPAAQAEAAPQQ
ncbi:SurA N-terminal domain-containing protein [Streptosporangium sp. NBC_01756]|uniref:SurA N-terminal domain-containing protein n=1 Tax=Streptosporangium sp. NBC_01756 TaxID=2975950 RepID=UPI002DDC0012|nr:SurA N-terminal domain-containing protein [Streptosporangium sp. NBC_01756]WSC89357.1 SurA N-terminal domain-containing protein [Streptosporangium sp. NBC_01756]